MSGVDGLAEVPVGVEEQSSSATSQISESRQGRFARVREALGRFLPRRREEQPAEEQQSSVEPTPIQAIELTQSQAQVEQKDERQLEEVREEIADIKTTGEPVAKEALPPSEPMRLETIDEIRKLLVSLPQEQHDDNGYYIPWRILARAEKKGGILDEETGLNLQVSYQDNPDNSLSPSSVQITLSTPELEERDFPEQSKADAEKMAEFLRIIYGDSPRLEEDIERSYLSVGEQRDRIKWTLSYNTQDGLIKSDFSALSEEDWVDIPWTATRSKRDVSEDGGQFLKSILERAVAKQIAEAEENARMRKEIVDRADPIPNDPTKVYEYAYHGTPLTNLPDIAEMGLLPSGSRSKETGTIFFADWGDRVTKGQTVEEEPLLFRFHITDMPEIASDWTVNGFYLKDGFHNQSVPTRIPIPREKLDFSLDDGKTWRSIVPPEAVKKAA